MPRGPLISDEMKLRVTELADEHPNWRALDIEEALWDEMGERAPGLSSIQKILAKLRRARREQAPEEPWSMGLLERDQTLTRLISPEAVPYVLGAWWSCLVTGKTFTAREAKWAARIGKVIGGHSPADLAIWAEDYAKAERTFEALGVPFETSWLDTALVISFMVNPAGPESLDSQVFKWVAGDFLKSVHSAERKSKISPRKRWDIIEEMLSWVKEYVLGRLNSIEDLSQEIEQIKEREGL